MEFFIVKKKNSIQRCTTVVMLFPIDSMTRNSMASSNSSSDEAEHKKTTWVQGGKIRTYGAGGAVVRPAWPLAAESGPLIP